MLDDWTLVGLLLLVVELIVVQRTVRFVRFGCGQRMMLLLELLELLELLDL